MVLTNNKVVNPEDVATATRHENIDGIDYWIETEKEEFWLSESRQDRPSDLDDGKKNKIFENDILEDIYGNKGKVVFLDGSFDIIWDDELLGADALWVLRNELTIVGIVPNDIEKKNEKPEPKFKPGDKVTHVKYDIPFIVTDCYWDNDMWWYTTDRALIMAIGELKLRFVEKKNEPSTADFIRATQEAQHITRETSIHFGPGTVKKEQPNASDK